MAKNRNTYEIVVYFSDEEGEGYIADPMTVDIHDYINITKESGMNRARSTANKKAALEEHLKKIGMTLEEFEALEKRTHIAFAYNDEGKIIIPRNNVQAFMVATTSELRAASKPCKEDQVRARIRMSSWVTEKEQEDGVFERFAVVTSGTGAVLSNQRALRRNKLICGFEARGTMSLDPSYVDPKTLKEAIEWGGENVGIGACRKMGYGRFELRKFEKITPS